MCLFQSIRECLPGNAHKIKQKLRNQKDRPERQNQDINLKHLQISQIFRTVPTRQHRLLPLKHEIRPVTQHSHGVLPWRRHEPTDRRPKIERRRQKNRLEKDY